MMLLTKEIIESVNNSNRIGILCTADADGKPNAACLGSLWIRDEKTLSVGSAGGRTLDNLKENPYAMFFCISESPVIFTTPGYRIYLKVNEIQTEGPVLDQIRAELTEKAGADAANRIKTAVVFDVVEVRKMVDME